MKSNKIKQTVNKFLGAAIIATLLIGFSHNTAAVAGLYQLKNKVPGAIRPPDYGLRLNNLFNNGSKWTFDFETAGAKVYLQTNGAGDEIHIFGTVFGGEDVGSVYRTGSTGFWDLDFTYSAGVTVTADGDGKSSVWVDKNDTGFSDGTLTYIGNAASGGTITDLMGNSVVEVAGADLTIRLQSNSGTGDKEFSFCYGAFPGVVPTPNGCGTQEVNLEDRVKGSGWLKHSGSYAGKTANVYGGDFGVTGVAAIPEPATSLLTSLGLIGLMTIRRQRLRI